MYRLLIKNSHSKKIISFKILSREIIVQIIKKNRTLNKSTNRNLKYHIKIKVIFIKQKINSWPSNHLIAMTEVC